MLTPVLSSPSPPSLASSLSALLHSGFQQLLSGLRVHLWLTVPLVEEGPLPGAVVRGESAPLHGLSRL